MSRQKKRSSETSSRRRRRRKTTPQSSFSHALRRLKKLNASEQHQAMGMANTAFIRQFCKELKRLKYAKLPQNKKKALQKHKKLLRQLTNNHTKMSKRRHILRQSGGGFLKSLLSAIPIIGSVVGLIDNI